MLDGDHTLEEAWRLRLATFRLSQECASRSVEYCNHAFNLLKTFEGHAHIWTRVFPTIGASSDRSADPAPATVRHNVEVHTSDEWLCVVAAKSLQGVSLSCHSSSRMQSFAMPGVCSCYAGPVLLLLLLLLLWQPSARIVRAAASLRPVCGLV